MKRILLYGLLLVALSAQAQDLLPWPTDTIDGKVYYKYTVEKSIGLYRISKNFGVSQEAILQANPALKTRGLRYEEVILIPTDLPATPKQPATPKMKPVNEDKLAKRAERTEKAVPVAEIKAALDTTPLVKETVLSVERDTLVVEVW